MSLKSGNTKINLDQMWIGALSGFAGPLITLYIYYVKTFKHLKFLDFAEQMISVNLHGQLLSLCVIINLLLFFIFIWTKKDRSANGVLLSTFFYAAVIFIIKLI